MCGPAGGLRQDRTGVPGRDVGRRLARVEDLVEPPPHHLLRARKAEPAEDGGGEVGQARALDRDARAEPLAGGGHDAVGAMPGDDARGDLGHEARTQVVAVETVVGDEEDARLGTREVDQSGEHEVVQAVGRVDDVLVDREVLLLEPFHPGRMVGHEHVGDLVDGAEVDAGQVPVVALHAGDGGGLDAEGLAQLLDELVGRRSFSRSTLSRSGMNIRATSWVSEPGWTRSASSSARRSSGQ